MTPEAKIEEIFHAHLVNINMFYGDMDKSEQWETNQVCLVDAIQALIVEARVDELENNILQGSNEIMIPTSAIKGRLEALRKVSE